MVAASMKNIGKMNILLLRPMCLNQTAQARNAGTATSWFAAPKSGQMF